jgi:hypothetical protein
VETWARERWQRAIEVFDEQGESRQLKLFPSAVEPPENDPNVARVSLSKVWLERARPVRNCFLAYGRARRVWVFDRGMLREENLAARRRRNRQYRVGTPRSKLQQFEAELLAGG